MAYRVHCDWCGRHLYNEDLAELPVAIKRSRNKRLDRLWAEEVRPTLHFCISSNDGYDRIGITARDSGEGCYERARALIEGTKTQPPDMGMEWRLLPIGALVHDPPTPGQEPDPELAEILNQLPAHCRSVLPRAGITTLAQVEEMTDQQLLAIKGLGAFILTRLREAQHKKA